LGHRSFSPGVNDPSQTIVADEEFAEGDIHFTSLYTMLNTPLTDRHIALGAKMAEFAGYHMPISYSTITDEHMAVRHAVGVFDVSHMGEFIVKGKGALAFLQQVTSNDVNKLKIGDAQYSCMPNLKGGIVDDLLVYRLDEDQCAAGEQAFMLVVNASNEKKDWRWLKKFAKNYEVKMTNISSKTGLIAVQGPKAAALLQKLTKEDLSAISYYTFRKGTLAGCKNVLISATGYTGSGGFELYARNQDISKIWDKVMAAGENFGIKPCGLGARDTLRLEMGFCLYGNDIDDKTSPLEAGLGWITKLKKGVFNSSERFVAQKEAGLKNKLVAFVMDEKRVPRHGYDLLSLRGAKIGVVTSGTHSPGLDKPIGMGYVKTKYAIEGSKIQVVMGGKQLMARITTLPFVKLPEL
jgi:aminomethyltransferase